MADNNRTVQRKRPTSVPDGTIGINSRSDPYGDALVQTLSASKFGLSDEGSFYVCINPTIGTTVAFPVMASFSDTAPTILVMNTDLPGGRNIFLDYLRLLPTTAPASGTCARFAIKVDTVSRTPTGGSNPITPQQLNLSQPNDAGAVVHFPTGGTALTVPAATGGARVVANGSLRSVIPVVLEEITLSFGQDFTGSGSPSTATKESAQAAPIVIPPGCSAAIHIWFPSNSITGLSAEYELGFVQR